MSKSDPMTRPMNSALLPAEETDSLFDDEPGKEEIEEDQAQESEDWGDDLLDDEPGELMTVAPCPPAFTAIPFTPKVEDGSLPYMTRAEAEAFDVSIRESKAIFAIRLYLFEQRKGWRALGFTSMSDYAETRLSESHQVVSQWMQQVENTCYIRQISIGNLATLLRNEIERLPQLLPQTITRQLARLPDPDTKRFVYQRMQDLKSVDAMGVKVGEWKRLVDQTLAAKNGHNAPPAPPLASAPPAAPALLLYFPEEVKLPEKQEEDVKPLEVQQTAGVPTAQPCHTFAAVRTQWDEMGTTLSVYFDHPSGVQFCATVPGSAVGMNEWKADPA